MFKIDSFQNIFLWGAIIPLILSNILHMLVVKKNYLNFLNFPIHEKWFGENKTYRGFLIVPILNGLLFMILNWPGGLLRSTSTQNFSIQNSLLNLDSIYVLFLIGFIFGIFYVSFELPNSLIKRSLGIKAGESSQRGQLFFKALDKTDSAFGLSLFFGYLNNFNLQLMLTFFVIAVFLHVILSLLLVALKIKKKF